MFRKKNMLKSRILGYMDVLFLVNHNLTPIMKDTKMALHF